MNCTHCEERMSDYLENALDSSQRSAMEMHLNSCAACTDLLEGIGSVLAWGHSFPVVQAPAWLPARILANTPRVVRETWVDTLASLGRWVIEPRTAMGLLTTVLMIGWMGSLVPL